MYKSLVIALALLACGHDGGTTQKMDAPAGDAPKGDAGGDGSMGNVDAAVTLGPLCGATTCMLGSEECCLSATSVCKPAGTCPSQGFLCDGPEDCPNAVCCYPNANNGSRCQTNSCQAVACHEDADCPTGTPKCCPKPFAPPNYNVCQAQC